MKIEIIDNKKFAEIWVDGEKWKEVHRRLYKNHLKEILRTPEKKLLSDLCLRIDVKIARSLVYKWLSLRGFMKSELTKKLTSYKIDPQAIADILSECEKAGYLDDQREGKLLIERGKRKGLGPQRVAFQLSQKAPELKGMAQSAFTDEEQKEEVTRWIKKKGANLSDLKVKQRLFRFLLSKGFDAHIIRKQLLVDE